MIELHTTWNLRAIMASKGLFQTTDLRPLLAERGVELSREQVYRLVTTPPRRISLDVLSALCDALECSKDELILTERREVEAPKTAVAEGSKAPIGDLRPVRARIRRRQHYRHIRMDAVAHAVISAVEPYAPGTGPTPLVPMIESLAPVHRTRRGVFIAISKRPGVLTGRDPNVPATVQTLTAALS